MLRGHSQRLAAILGWYHEQEDRVDASSALGDRYRSKQAAYTAADFPACHCSASLHAPVGACTWPIAGPHVRQARPEQASCRVVIGRLAIRIPNRQEAGLGKCVDGRPSAATEANVKTEWIRIGTTFQSPVQNGFAHVERTNVHGTEIEIGEDLRICERRCPSGDPHLGTV